MAKRLAVIAMMHFAIHVARSSEAATSKVGEVQKWEDVGVGD